MFGIGTGELLLILVIAMLVVGPERMVDYARRGGRLLAKIRSQTDEVTRDFREALQGEMGEGDDANPLAVLNQLKTEAEEAARDVQGVLTGAAPVDRPAVSPAADRPATAPAAQPELVVPVEPPSEAASPPDDELVPAPAVTDLTPVELIDDAGLELGGPELIETLDADAAETAESEGER